MEEKQYTEVIKNLKSIEEGVKTFYAKIDNRIFFRMIIIIVWLLVARFQMDNAFKNVNEKLEKASKQTEQLSKQLEQINNNITKTSNESFDSVQKQYVEAKNGTLVKDYINTLAKSADNYENALTAYTISKKENDSLATRISFEKMIQYADTYPRLQYLLSPEFEKFMTPEIRKQINDKLAKLKL